MLITNCLRSQRNCDTLPYKYCSGSTSSTDLHSLQISNLLTPHGLVAYESRLQLLKVFYSYTSAQLWTIFSPGEQIDFVSRATLPRFVDECEHLKGR